MKENQPQPSEENKGLIFLEETQKTLEMLATEDKMPIVDLVSKLIKKEDEERHVIWDRSKGEFVRKKCGRESSLENQVPLTSLMRLALCAGYLAMQKVFEDNEYKPIKEIIKYSQNGNVSSIEFLGLTREIVWKVEDAVWKVKIARDENNLDEQENPLGFACEVPIAGSLTNSAFFKIT